MYRADRGLRSDVVSKLGLAIRCCVQIGASGIAASVSQLSGGIHSYLEEFSPEARQLGVETVGAAPGTGTGAAAAEGDRDRGAGAAMPAEDTGEPPAKVARLEHPVSVNSVQQLRHYFWTISHAVSSSITPYPCRVLLIYLVPMRIAC